MTLIENLEAIDKCKQDIKTALIEKGGEGYLDGTSFSGYAEKIRALKLESGDTPSTPSADYIYTNGYKLDGDIHDIVEFVPYEVVLDSNNQYIVELVCPEEIPSYEGSSYCDVIFTVDIPNTYNITNFEFFDAVSGSYNEQPYKENPRHSTTIRNGVTYKSYVRAVEDNIDYGSEYISYDTLQYRITIEKI